MLTPSEFKKNIAASEHADWFKNQKLEFNFIKINQKFELNGVSTVFEYVTKEFNSWSTVLNEIPTELKASYDYFNSMYGTIEHLVSKLIDQPISQIENLWREVQKQVQSIHNNPFPFNSSEAQFLIKIHKENPKSFHGAYNYIIGQEQPYLQRKQDFTGALMAYEYLNKDSDILKRRNDEKNSISRLKNEFQEYLNRTEQDVISLLQNTNINYTEHLKAIEKLKDTKEYEIEILINKIEDGYSNFDKDSKSRMEELEKTYQEKLKLSKPAEYWSERAIELKKQGWNSLYILIGLVTVVITLLGLLLWHPPKEVFESFFGDDKAAAIRWSIIFITFITFIAFCIRAVTKVMFSSFHLARDSEERHTLTYFYLSLMQDSKVADSDRQLIMQSLFSRAETGLLKDDASPTMPNDIVGKMMTR